MQKYLLILLTSTILFSFTKDTTIMDVKEKTVTINDIPVYNFESLEPLLYTDSNKIHIVNFWAMWCAPCIKELPILKEFEKNNPNVEITLVSLDFPEDIETRLKPFLERKGITSKVVLLDDPDQNSWINKIDPNWSGAIPFTIIFNNENRTFHERAFNDIKDLENEVYNTINK
ncbi:TlpA family protein disulfide reductase [Maribacter dokdonensis]|uniref:TlpA family protein disulfide reductase n=1 Tax=Maribacter dokdonensis TaxID=320912 RepID=UPI002AB01526|nr:TlpA disulfide reductase family protein [Maribacter dokdonensis]